MQQIDGVGCLVFAKDFIKTDLVKNPIKENFDINNLPINYNLASCNLSFGDVNAPVKILMYFSPTCSHCSEFEENTLKEIDERFIKTGKVYFTICLLPFHRLDYAVAKLIYKSAKDPQQQHQLIKLFLSRQGEWLQPLMQSPKDKSKLLTKKITATAGLLNLSAAELQKQLAITSNDDLAFLKLFALGAGFSLAKLMALLVDDADLEENLTANHIQAEYQFGYPLDRIPAFIVNDKPIVGLLKISDIEKVL